MNNLHKYNDFLFESIINDIFLLLESDEPSPTFTWDIKKPTEETKEVGEVSIATNGVLVGNKPIWLHDGAEIIGNIYENPELLSPNQI